MKCATLIAIEGPDRVGKETQSKKLLEYLLSKGKKVYRLEVPINNGITYKMIYWMLRCGLAKKLPILFQFVQALNKNIFMIFNMKKIMKEYDYVVFDRWKLSAYVYGNVTNVPLWLNNIFYFFLKDVDMYIVLLGRPFKKENLDVYEKDTILQKNVRKEYMTACMSKIYKTSAKFLFVCSESSIDIVHEKIKMLVDNV